MIKVVLWDLDNTLLDFPAAERVALRQTFADFSLGFCTEEQIARFSVLNLSWWKRLERGEITKAQLLPGRVQEFFQAEGHGGGTPGGHPLLLVQSRRRGGSGGPASAL